MSNKWRAHLWYILAALVILMLFQSWYISSQQIDRIDYSEFRQLLEEGRIESVQVSENHIAGELKQPQEAGGPTRFETTRVPPDIAEELEQYGVSYDGRVETNFLSNLLSFSGSLIYRVISSPMVHQKQLTLSIMWVDKLPHPALRYSEPPGDLNWCASRFGERVHPVRIQNRPA